ncbi:MAG TPA: hypothetical protein VFC68_04950, partial [Treponemataceae bacterium]|nr:hypothetical protein [Treponemataceae bacterium]
DTVMQLLAVFYGKHKKNVHEKNIKEKEEGFDGCDSKKDPARILKKIYGAIEDVLSRKTGLLTLFNHIRGNKHHWLVFPINHEIPLKNTKKTIRGEGSVRILLDIEQKMAEKTIIMLRFSNKIYKFVLKCNSLEFCTIPDIIQKERKTSVDALSTIIGSNSLEVRYNSEISQQGFYNENAVIPFIQTEA